MHEPATQGPGCTVMQRNASSFFLDRNRKLLDEVLREWAKGPGKKWETPVRAQVPSSSASSAYICIIEIQGTCIIK